MTTVQALVLAVRSISWATAVVLAGYAVSEYL
jgi:hypothetical protein